MIVEIESRIYELHSNQVSKASRSMNVCALIWFEFMSETI